MKGNSTVRVQLLEGSGIDYVHSWRLKEQQFLLLNLCKNQDIIVMAACYNLKNGFFHCP